MLASVSRRTTLIGLCLLAISARPSSSVPNIGQAEQQLLFLLNQSRSEQGLKPLELDERLTQAARKHSLEMAQRGALTHQFSGELSLRDRLAATSVAFDAVAENVAQSNSAQDAHTEFMHSPGHRANILDAQYNAIGIAVAAGRNQQLYFTEDFAHRIPHLALNDLRQKLLDNMNAVRAKRLLPPLTAVNISMLDHEACRAEVNTKAISRSFSSAGWVVVFTASEPSELPPDIVRVVSNREARSVAIGVCYPQGESFALLQAVNIFFRTPQP